MSISVLATDGYKFSMAEAGWPLRKETFYFTFRRGGAQVVPFDVAAYVKSLLPRADASDYAFLADHEYAMGDAFKAAIRDGQVQVHGAPKGAWVLPREPLVDGDGAVGARVVARAAHAPGALPHPARDARDARSAARSRRPSRRSRARRSAPWSGRRSTRSACVRRTIHVDADGVRVACERASQGARARSRADGSRVFEVGLRSATCVEQHLVALEACSDAGHHAHEPRPRRAARGHDPGRHDGPRARAALRLRRGRVPRDEGATPAALELPARHVRHVAIGHPHRARDHRGGPRRARLDPLRLRRQGGAVRASPCERRRSSACGPCTFSKTASTPSSSRRFEALREKSWRQTRRAVLRLRRVARVADRGQRAHAR